MSNIVELRPDLNTLLHFSQEHSLIEGVYLAKAIRLFVIVQSLYGLNSKGFSPISLRPEPKQNKGSIKDDYYKDFKPDEFKYVHWRNSFFKDADEFHKTEEKPTLHDPNCYCAKTIRYWLFEQFGVDEQEWKNVFLDKYKISEEYLDIFYGRLFSVTGKILGGTNKSSYFSILVKLGWLEKKGSTYKKVKNLPNILSENSNSNLDLFEHFYQIYFDDSLATTSELLKEKNRFFVKLQHIISKENTDKIGIIIEELRQIWEQKEIPLVHINYESSSLQKQTELIVYPICLFYNQRCIYLTGYGSMPNNPTQLNYYNYRLDHLCKYNNNQYINILNWDEDNLDIHYELFDKKQELNTKTSVTIYEEIEKALGVDLHRKIKTMLLRFPEPFHKNYIEGSNRHPTFQRLDFKNSTQFLQELKQRFKTHNTDIKNTDEQLIEKTLKTYHNDAYYTMDYRHGEEGGSHIEADVIMRLRAWCPNVEVLLPWDLRQRMREDMQKTWALYQDDN